MLPRVHRLTARESYRHAVRRGRRAGSSRMVVHLHLPADPGPAPARVGLIVSKAVGPAVTRNLVKRRLRHLVRERLTSLPESAVLVIRALPPSAASSSDELGRDLDRCLGRVLPAGVSR